MARFPRAEPPRIARRLFWTLAGVAASLTLVIGLSKAADDSSDFSLASLFEHVYDHIMDAVDAHQTVAIVARVQQSQPKVFVDGQPAPPLEYGRTRTIIVDVPGDGAYSIISLHRKPSGWIEAGRIHGNAIEFQAGSKQVRIECTQPITDSDRAVFIRRRD